MGSETGKRVAKRAGGTPPVDPGLLARPEVRAALADHDIGALFRALNDNDWTQREIAAAIGMQQSSVSDIIKGRRVIGHHVLGRIADGLGIPREWMDLGPGDGGVYAGGVAAPDSTEEVRAEMRRRVLLAAAGIAIAGRPIQGIGELAELAGPSPVPLPDRIFGVHVAKVRDLTQRLRGAGRAYGSDPQVTSASAAWATRLLSVQGAEPIKRALLAAVAELHNLAGWEALDASLYDRAMHHLTRGLELATDAGDAYLQAIALMYAGLATEEHGHPNDGLKMLQLGQVKAADILSDSQRIGGTSARTAVESCVRAYSAIAMARLGYQDAADAELATARELWQPTPADPSGDLDIEAARLQLERGRLDVAEPFAVASVRRWDGGLSPRARTISGILQATIHVRAGEPAGLALAHTAITGVTKLSSVRARQRLNPLVIALESRSGSDYRQLARTARQVATTRA
ncbi:MAG: helix-turn-helix domain-containing protein [Pseudonocardiaceae bacterium]